MGRIFAILAAALVVWWSAIYLVPNVIAPNISSQIAACGAENFDETKCNARLSQLGQAGDLFGAVTSLFSGLGLFAVAFTVWSDSRQARKAKKPLVVCVLNNDAIGLEQAAFDHKSLRISIAALIKNLGEPALNVSLSASVICGTQAVPFEKFDLEVPLTLSEDREVALMLVLQGAALISLLNQLLHQGAPELHIELNYVSLEKVFWRTTAKYTLKCNAQAKNLLAALEGNDQEVFDGLWSGGAIAPLVALIKPNGWAHEPIKIR